MSLMFFISGLFVCPSLRRSGALAFLRGRFIRLGVPFVVGIPVFMPLAYYASWQLTGHDQGYLAYWSRTFTQAWPPGPLWFNWFLLFCDILAAGFLSFWPNRMGGLPLSWTKGKPLSAAAAMFGLCAVVYLPALKAFGWEGVRSSCRHSISSLVVLVFMWLGLQSARGSEAMILSEACWLGTVPWRVIGLGGSAPASSHTICCRSSRCYSKRWEL